MTAAAPAAGATVSVELLLGGAAHLDTRLRVEQAGEPDLDFTARWVSKPLDDPPYYVVRVSLEQGGGRWELQLVHDKMVLADPPPQIQHLEVTHGYNLLTVNRAFALRWCDLRVGAGVVLPHAESTVRWQACSSRGGILGSGYAIRGPAATAGAGRRFPLGGRVFLPLDVALTAAWTTAPVAGGEAEVWNLGAHAALGVGVGF